MGTPGALRCLILLALGCGLCWAGVPGTEFVTVFMQNHHLHSGSPHLLLSLTALSPSTNITIAINRHFFRKKVTLDERQTTTIQLPAFIEMPPSQLFPNSVIVMSNNPISVVSINSKDLSSDSTSLYPMEELGTEYYVVTPTGGPEESFKEFAVVASKEPTAITIYLTGKVTFQDREYRGGSKLTFNLEPFEAVEFQSKDDLSGTKVLSRRPVAVLSGHTCSWKHTKCNHVYEQLQPVSSWANTFLIPPLSFQTKYDLVYVTASQNTQVSYQAGLLKQTTRLNAGEALEIQLKPLAPLFITSTEGIQVLFYCAGGNKGNISYDTFLMGVPDVTTFCTSYHVLGQEDFYNQAVIVAKTSSLSGITVDKFPLLNVQWQKIPETEYSWGEYSLGSNTKPYLFEHNHSPFGLIISRIASMNAYGEPAICVYGSSRPSCNRTKCRKKEICKIVQGQAACLADSEAVCWAWGDPHYHTFDGKNYDFQGTCTYTMAKTCGSDLTLPTFNVEIKNENRGSSRVSYLSSVTIQVYGYNITGVRSEYGIVRVNSQKSQLPVTLHDEQLRIFQSGTSFILLTKFALRVFYDWNILLKVYLPSSFSENVCGLCGNYNGDPRDDLTSTGLVPLNPIEFGQSWKVEENSNSTCWDDCNGECKKCSPQLMQQYGDKSSCGLLSLRADGPFKLCHAVIDPQIYKDNCVYDLCMNDGYHQILCQALKTYSDACRIQRVIVYEWRKITECNMQCPDNSTYKSCGSACPATCQDPGAPLKCTDACIESCECDPGFVLIEGKCLPRERCGCSFEGRFYAPNETFWGDTECWQKCVCNGESRRVECKKSGCRAGEECTVRAGLQDCYATTYGVCSASGDPHYITYDGFHYNFQGTCRYQLSGLCNQNHGLIDFQVHVLNQNRGSRSVSYTTAVNVTIYDTEIQIRREYPDQVLVNGLLANLPLTLNSALVSVFRSGRHCVIKSRHGLRVTFDWDARVAVTVPSSYAGSVCGLCGNFNGNPGDDLIGRNGSLTNDIVDFGQSWKVGEVPGCREVPEKGCHALESLDREQRKSREGCGQLLDKNGPFRECHAIIPPGSYFEDCVYDLCAFGRREDITCRLISGYTSACQEASANVYPWRSDQFCRLACPTNSHYNICTSGCPSSCVSLSSSYSCDSLCKEGCACDDGFVLSGGLCVPLSGCGCSYNGQYYKPGEIFYPKDTCEQRCSCRIGGSVVCTPFSCGPYEECRVEKGVQGCQPLGSAVCSAVGESNYRTFDGLGYDFYGNCSYILSKTCILNGSHLNPFLVRVRNQKWVTSGVSYRKAITLEVYNYTINIHQASESQILVNGIRRHLPFELESGKLRAENLGLGFALSTDFGLVITSDLSLRVTVPGNYRNQTCGLCGNYNDNPRDDLHQTDGDAIAFAALWKDTDSEETCNTSEACMGGNPSCPVCQRSKAETLSGENFCGIITVPVGPFATCHAQVDPSEYLSGCVAALCTGSGDLCLILQNYARACQDAGVTIKSWRTPSFCPLSCPEHSHFESCADLCSNSCSSLYDTSSCPTVCSEGCQCDTGYLFGSGRCVSPDQCGCYQNMTYYQANETIISEDCSQRCVCNSDQSMVCKSYSCPPDEICTIITGVVRCINVDPCKSVPCRNKETCKIQGGNPACVPDYTGTCWGWGDPHYQTFDGYNFDFQGTCTYVLAKYIGDDSGLVPFSIEERNDNRGSQAVSFVRLVNIFVHGYKITIVKGEFGKVRVNDEITNLPLILLGGKISVSLSGLNAVLSTDFGLQVTYEYNWNVMINLPSSYHGSTGGLCGNFNQNPSDDKISLDNTSVSSIMDWAKSWKVNEKDPFCLDICHGNCPTCDESKKSLYRGDEYCGLIIKVADGPFRNCHPRISPNTFFDNCIYDVCSNSGVKPFLCQALQSYANACRKQGVNIDNWRIPSGCSLQCPENSRYEACGNACPASCFDRTASGRCTEPCVETCQCNEGYVLSTDKCVPITSCGCNQNGLYYQPNQEFWSDDKCGVYCKCDPNLGMVMCKETSCKARERCMVVNGIHGCHPANYSTCVASGDPHYTTFDGKRFDFMGTCIYQLAGVCSTDPSLTPFQIKVQNDQRGNKAVSYTKAVTLEVYNQSITLSKDYPRYILLNGVLTSLPFHFKTNKIKAYIRGEHAFVRTDFDVTVNFNWNNYARVVMPSTYAGAVCGLCGNYNQDPNDDLSPRNGNKNADQVRFGDIWKVGEVPGCTAGCKWGCPQCSEEQTLKYKSKEYCGVLNKVDGPFNQCYEAIDPLPYVNDCVYDSCQYQGRYSAVCGAIAAYVSQCQEKRINIQEWRTPSFCSISCPSHSHFEMCGSGCPATCYRFSSPVDCEKSCTEGCYCDSGFLLSGDECVPISQCGCVFRERYYKKWEKFYPEGQCKDQCQCGEFGNVHCQAVTCGPNEECRVVNGVHGCHSTGQGTCVISGSSHYISFDGLTYNFYGTCSYVLAEVCSGDLHLGNFSIVVENENVGNSNTTVTRSVKVNVYGYVITMERGMQWKVKVNEEINVVPLILEKGKIRINQEGNSIILQTDFDLMVLYDAMFSARLTIPGAYRSAICGLCGDFNGQSNDDFRRPSGELSASVEEFGSSWKATWEGHDCVDGRKEPHNGCNPITGAIFGRDEECGQLLIENGPFMECNKLVNATDYFNHCLYDMCAHHGEEQTVCESLQAYATACQSSGAKMKPWRRPAFCPLSCPDNSHYELCTRTCDITCASITTPSSCSDRCFEGCECDPGYVFDGDRCVTMDRCGCMYNGRYLSLGASLVIPDCLQRCSCENGGVVMCSNFSCSDTEFCGLQNGNRGCFEKQGTCSLSLQGNLTSFDNLSGPVAHVDTFELASVCNLTSDVWFRLVVIPQQCRNEDGFRVSALHAYFPNVSISINPNGEAWVNGHAVELPAQVSSSLSVSSVKGALVINSGTDMELVMSESGELTLHVSPELTGALCGACGNFNRQISDDLQGARGKPAATFSEFIASWQACDFSRCEPLKIRAV